MKKKLPLQKFVKFSLLALCFLGTIPHLNAQGVGFTLVNPNTGEITITNTGAMVDISSYWLCINPGVYQQLSTITPTNGDYMLSQDESVTLTFGINSTSDGLGLFSTNTFGSQDSSILLSYIQYGAANQFRVSQAVNAGRWDNANNFVSGTAPYTTSTGGSASAWNALSVDDFNASFEFAVYPNPVQNELSITYEGSQSLNLDITIINMLGQQVKNIDVLDSRNTTLDVTDLTSGAYFLSIRDKVSGSSLTKQVIKY